MKVSVPLNELSRKMNAISGVVPGKTTMPILSTVLMSAEKGIFSISATDLDISVTSKVNGRVTEEGKIAVPARKLAEIVKSLAGEEVALDTAGDKLTLSCGKSRFVVNARSADDFPRLPKQESKTAFMIDPEIVGALVQKTTYAVSNGPHETRALRRPVGSRPQGNLDGGDPTGTASRRSRSRWISGPSRRWT